MICGGWESANSLNLEGSGSKCRRCFRVTVNLYAVTATSRSKWTPSVRNRARNDRAEAENAWRSQEYKVKELELDTRRCERRLMAKARDARAEGSQDEKI
jgi:hypothetical protein